VFRSRLHSSLLLLSLLACAPAGDLQAREITGLRGEASTVVKGGVKLLRRFLGLARDSVAVVSHAVSLGRREAALELSLVDGTTSVVALQAGELRVNGVTVGRYRAGGALDRAWRRLLTDVATADTRSMVATLRAFKVGGLAGADAEAERRLTSELRGLTPVTEAQSSLALAEAAAAAQDVAAHLSSDSLAHSLTLADVRALDSLERLLHTVPDIGPDLARSARRSPVRIGHVTVAAGDTVRGGLVVFRGNADVFGTVAGDVVALAGDVICHDGGLVDGSAVAVGGRVIEAGGTIRGDIKMLTTVGGVRIAKSAAEGRPAAFDRLFTDVGTVVALFIALAMVGFGTVFFGRRYVEVVADTSTHSFGRSFVVGLLGQMLLLPTFAMLVVGLALTIVGILLIPFVAVAYVLGAALALLGGYLAIAHAVGETVTRRRMANGAFVRSPNSYGYIFTGLVGLLGLWAAAALFGWIGPVVILFRVAAVLVTWVAATTGFGAVLLSRAGLRETFAGRYSGEMTDEYLWATPPATPTAARMGRQQ